LEVSLLKRDGNFFIHNQATKIGNLSGSLTYLCSFRLNRLT
jgi:hypothetical protein